ncbi:glycosyl hydrolase, partial [Nocardioides sp.]|uniref:glycosyl hydrolase n=1 Tax=Nocardioides sp. TaxID=35761 RepID=UPI002ED5495A
RRQLVRSYGVVVHPSWAEDPRWGKTDRWMGMLADLGVKQIRGLVVPHQDECRRTARLCRRYGIKWLMTVTADGRLSPRETRHRVRQIADDYADIVLGLEGVNEPDTSKDGWARHTVDIQRAIWEACNNQRALKGVKVVSPSLHDRDEDVSDGAGYRALKRQGIREYCDVVGLHSYPRGRRITTGLAERLKLVDIAYKGKPVWITEFGWTNYSGGSGQRPTSEARAARLAARGIPRIADHPRVQKAFRYELLNDTRHGGGSPGAHYGLARADWSRKPEFRAVRRVLHGR